MNKRNTQEEAMSRLFRTVQKKPQPPAHKDATPPKPATSKAAATQTSPPAKKTTPRRAPAKKTSKPIIGAEARAAEHERIAPYIRPDQAMALRMAEATKRDPRGRTVSAIIRQLLDEAGYNATYQPKF